MVGCLDVELVLFKLTNPGVFVDQPFPVFDDDVSNLAKFHDLDLVAAVEARRHVGSDGDVIALRHVWRKFHCGHCYCSFGDGETRWSKL